jgi:hypothetical protein
LQRQLEQNQIEQSFFDQQVALLGLSEDQKTESRILCYERIGGSKRKSHYSKTNKMRRSRSNKRSKSRSNKRSKSRSNKRSRK